MEITINLDTLTPAQAFQIGFQLRERPEYREASVIQETAEPKLSRRTRKERRPGATRRFVWNTSASMDIIQLGVYLYKSGLILAEVAETLNERQVRSISGKPWTEQMVWAVIYSKQAKSLWKDA
jgi:hypothetical protein